MAFASTLTISMVNEILPDIEKYYERNWSIHLWNIGKEMDRLKMLEISLLVVTQRKRS